MTSIVRTKCALLLTAIALVGPVDCALAQVNFPGDRLSHSTLTTEDGILIDLWDPHGLPSEGQFGPAFGCQQGCCEQSLFRAGRLHETLGEFMAESWLDHQDFYSFRGLTLLGVGLGTAAVLANTSLDEDFQGWHDDHIRSRSADKFADAMKCFGEGNIMIPVFVGSALLGTVCDLSNPHARLINEWGNRCSRTLVLGGPAVLALKYSFSAGRPNAVDSQWYLFSVNRGVSSVSGHAFVGAIPFINAAMMTDNLLLKTAFYTASVLPAWSRIEHRMHYLSQAFLGWGIAYLAADVVYRTELFQRNWTIIPQPMENGFGVMATCRW